MRTFGDVSCDIRYDGVVKGQPVTPQATHKLMGQRSSSSLMVTIIGPNGNVGSHRDQVAAMVNAVWSQLA